MTLTPGDASIGVTASITDDGGSSVTGLDYSLDGGPFTSTGTTSPTFTIPGLVNGTSYTVSVRADNAIGNGAASAPASAIPLTVPGAPTNVVAASDSASADVSWTAPASDGGSLITGYTATAYTSSAGTTTAGTACTTASLACSVTGLTNGTTYYVGVVATNAAGSSVTSSPLQAVTPIARPGAPTVTAVNSGNSYLSVAFTAGSAGGDPITSYQYSLDEGNIWTTASGTVSPLIIDGLTDGTTYTVLLRAVSAAGPGAASSPQTGTPYTYPDAVSASSITANGENASAVVSWAAPAWDGGAPISNQTVERGRRRRLHGDRVQQRIGRHPAGDVHDVGRAELHAHQPDQRHDVLHLDPGRQRRRTERPLDAPGAGDPVHRPRPGLGRHRRRR